MQFIIRWLATAVAVGAAVWLVPGIAVLGTTESWIAVAITGLALSLIDMSIKPLLQLLSLPITCLTFGIFYLGPPSAAPQTTRPSQNTAPRAAPPPPPPRAPPPRQLPCCPDRRPSKRNPLLPEQALKPTELRSPTSSSKTHHAALSRSKPHAPKRCAHGSPSSNEQPTERSCKYKQYKILLRLPFPRFATYYVTSLVESNQCRGFSWRCYPTSRCSRESNSR